ncbi:small multi-drug export protein [candidate division WOR-3 bacterium]|nr:small multi-drug export protein [candidate division WOR-3 bacterium]
MNSPVRQITRELSRKLLLGGLLMAILILGVTPAEASTGERVAEKLWAQGLSPELVVFVVAMLPIVELRGAVPIGNNLFHLPLWKTLVLSVAGNILPIILILLILERMVLLLSRFTLFKRFFDWLFRRTRRKSGVIERFEFWGLAIFVGIPLPVTGAWTGAVAAMLLGMSYPRALLGIFLGVLIAAGIVTALSLLGWWGAVIAALGLTVILLSQFRKGRKSKPDAPE